MLVVNNKTLIYDVRLANGVLNKSKGLMFENKNKFNYALIFDFKKENKFNCSLTMLFVFFPIDVIFLSNDKKVVEKATLNPWKINYTPKVPARYVIELPVGLAKDVKINDVLYW